MRLMITGHNGYLGSVIVPAFLEAGQAVVGLDSNYFRECTLVPEAAEVPSINKDIRDLKLTDLEGFDAIVHLAALCNDPLGALSEGWTEEINVQAAARLASLGREAGVKRFLFSSSCIMYGTADSEAVSEQSPLSPQTAYAASKAKAENLIAGLATDWFSPTFLRNGTIYGLSPRMRFDTVFNDLLGQAFTTKKVVVQSNGTPWRPVIHALDVARAFLAVLEAPTAVVHNQIFNVGHNSLNYRIIDLAEIACATVPGCSLEVRGEPTADQRTYRADFSKFQAAFPRFEWQWTAAIGAQQLYAAFETLGLDHETFTDNRFTRVRWLHHLRESGQLDGTLRWVRPAKRKAGRRS